MSFRRRRNRTAAAAWGLTLLCSVGLSGCSHSSTFLHSPPESEFQTPDALSRLDDSLRNGDAPDRQNPPVSERPHRGRLRALRFAAVRTESAQFSASRESARTAQQQQPSAQNRAGAAATEFQLTSANAVFASPTPPMTDSVTRLSDAWNPGGLTDTGSRGIERVAGQVSAPAPDAFSNLKVSTMDLGTVLSAVGGQHPAVGFARWRVQEAYAEQLRAQSLWLPSIQGGVSFHQHDGNLQNSNGNIQDVNRSSIQAGLGTGATGAGTTPNPGIVARFHMADAIFAPSIAQKNSYAQSHAATAAVNDQLLEASLAWLQLVTTEQRVAILTDSLERTEQLSGITMNFAEAGQGLRSDAERMTTEKSLARNRLITAQEDTEVASLRLIQAISAGTGQRIVPAEQSLVPIQLINAVEDSSQLIGQGLRDRPELKEAQCLVAAACERYQRQKYGPFVPSVLLGMSQSGFGGGQGLTGDSFNDRTDFDAALTWELRGLGYGEQAARRSTQAQVEQARFRQVRLMDQIAREIGEAHVQVQFRKERITVAERGIESAEQSVRHNLDRIRNGQGLPIEALQAIRALEDSRLAYLQAVSDYNESQFRLYRAMGHPVYAAVPQQ